MDLVSIVIPTYNRPEFLKRAVESVLKQSYTGYELLIVNDSDDEDAVKKVIQEFNDNRIQYCRNSRTKGGNGARNTGILKAKGQYIAFLDDDDEWLPNKLEYQINNLSQLDTSWGGCYCGYNILEYGIWRNVNDLKEGAIQRVFLLSKNSIGSGSTLIFTRDAIEKTGLFDEELQRYQDIHFLTVFLRRYKLAFVNKVLVKINGHNRPPAATAEQAKLALFNKIKQDINRLDKRDQREYFAFQYRELAVLFSLEGNTQKVIEYIKKSLLYKVLFPTRYIKIILCLIDNKTGLEFNKYGESLKNNLKRSRLFFKIFKRIV